MASISEHPGFFIHQSPERTIALWREQRSSSGVTGGFSSFSVFTSTGVDTNTCQQCTLADAPNGEALRIAPGQNNFSFDFAALDLAEPGRLRYAYRLDGFDPDWVQTGPELRSASYGSLAPGSYVMRIRATNRHGQWSSHEFAVPVTVEAAWWQHTSLVVAAVVALIAAMYGVIQLRTRQLRDQHLILESKVQERTKALEEASLTDP